MNSDSRHLSHSQSARTRPGAPSFPEELVGHIADCLRADNDVETLLILQRVSQEGYRVATPHIYRSIDLDTPERLERLFRPLTVLFAFAQSEKRQALTDAGLDFIKANGFCRVQMDRRQAHYEVKREASRIRATDSGSSISGLDRLVSKLHHLAVELGLSRDTEHGHDEVRTVSARQSADDREEAPTRTSQWTPDGLQRVRNAFRLVERITLRFSTISTTTTTTTRPMLLSFLASWLLDTDRLFPRLDSVIVTQSAVVHFLNGPAYRKASSIPQITEHACLQALLCRLDPEYCCFEDAPPSPTDLEPSTFSLRPIVPLRLYPIRPQIRLQNVHIHAQQMSYRLTSLICCVVGRVPTVHVSFALPTVTEELVALLRLFLQLCVAVNTMMGKGHPHGQRHETEVRLCNTTESGDKLYDVRLMETYGRGVCEAVLRQTPQFVTVEDGRMTIKHVSFGKGDELPRCPSCSGESFRPTLLEACGSADYL